MSCSQYGIPMACSGPGPARFQGDPNYRDHRHNDHKHRAPRRRAYFNDSLHEVSVKIQHPSLITFREFVGALLVLWTLYNLFVSTAKAKEILMDWDVGSYCFRGVSFSG